MLSDYDKASAFPVVKALDRDSGDVAMALQAAKGIKPLDTDIGYIGGVQLNRDNKVVDFLEKSGMKDDAYNSALVKYLNPSIDVKNINKDYTYIVPMFSPNNAGVKFSGSNWIDIIEPHLNLKRTFDAINDAKIHISKMDRYENEINSINSLNVTMKDLNFINHKDPNYVFESGIIYWYSMDLLNSVKDELNHSSAEWEGINTKVELVSKAVNLVRSGYLAPKTRVTVYTKNSHNYGKVHNLIVYFLDDFNYRLGRIDRCKKAFMT